MSTTVSNELHELARLLRPIQAEAHHALRHKSDSSPKACNPIEDFHEAANITTSYLERIFEVTPNIKKFGNLIGMDISEGRSPFHSANSFSSEVDKLIKQRMAFVDMPFAGEARVLINCLDNLYLRLIAQVSEFVDRLTDIIDAPDAAAEKNGGYSFSLSLVLDPGETASKLNQALNAGLRRTCAPKSFGGSQLGVETAIQASENIPESAVADIISSFSDKIPGRWEYTVLYANKKGYFSNALSGISKNFEEQVSRLGGWGWELVTVTPIALGWGDTISTVWIFKRPKP